MFQLSGVKMSELTDTVPSRVFELATEKPTLAVGFDFRRTEKLAVPPFSVVVSDGKVGEKAKPGFSRSTRWPSGSRSVVPLKAWSQTTRPFRSAGLTATDGFSSS